MIFIFYTSMIVDHVAEGSNPLAGSIFKIKYYTLLYAASFALLRREQRVRLPPGAPHKGASYENYWISQGCKLD